MLTGEFFDWKKIIVYFRFFDSLICISYSGLCTHCCSRVKSLSKGNNAKKDVVNLKESISVPLSSVASNASNFEEDITNSWPEDTPADDYDFSEESYEQERPVLKKSSGRLETVNLPAQQERYQRSNVQNKWKDQQKVNAGNTNADGDLDALLQVTLIEIMMCPYRFLKEMLLTVKSFYMFLGGGGPCQCS